MNDDTDAPDDMAQAEDVSGVNAAESGATDAPADYGEDPAQNQKTTKKTKKKMRMRTKVALSVIGVLSVLIWFGMQPIVGTIRYGICKTFIELQIPYPPTLQINTVEEYEQAVRIYFSHIDAFGSSRLNMIECSFRPDPRTGLALERVRLNREDLPEEDLKSFNLTIPFIIQNPPDLRLPVFKGEDLMHLKIDYN
jgi:hypothetical protein